MTIPVSTVVNVSISTTPIFPSRAGFGTLNIVTNETGVIGVGERIRFYSDIAGVVADWGSSSEATKAATAYFSQQPKPTRLAISVRFDAAQSGQLAGGTDRETDIPTWAAITDGEFNITLADSAGVETNSDISGLNFSSGPVTTLAEVATVIETAIQNVGVGGYTSATVEEAGNYFVITNGETGVLTMVSFMSEVSPAGGTSIVDLFGGGQGSSTASNGTDAETVTESLDAIESKSSDWYGLLFTKEVRDGFMVNASVGAEEAAAWTEARVKVFGNTTNNVNSLNAAIDTDILTTFKNASYRRTISTFSSTPEQYPSASMLARAFTVNFAQTDSTITLKFKQLPGITVEDISSNEKNGLDSKNGNAFIDVGGNFMYAESYMANGIFFDEVHGVDWLQNAIENNVFGYLYTRPTKVPLTDKGGAAIEQQVIKALDEGINNGLLAPGTTIDGIFLQNGYTTTVQPVSDIPKADKEARKGPNVTFTAILAGAVHSEQINGILER